VEERLNNFEEEIKLNKEILNSQTTNTNFHNFKLEYPSVYNISPLILTSVRVSESIWIDFCSKFIPYLKNKSNVRIKNSEILGECIFFYMKSHDFFNEKESL
jgi:hypothetical protein